MKAVNNYRHFRNVMPSKNISCVTSWALLTLLVNGVAAQPSVVVASSHLTYESTLVGYRAWTDQPVQSWREANERVGSIGGWRAYSREVEPVKVNTPVQPVGVQPKSPSDGHHGQHQRQMGRQP